MPERQLDRVADLLDLVGQAADVVVVDVGHLVEHEIGDLGPLDRTQSQPGADVDEQAVAEIGRLVAQPGRQDEPHLGVGRRAHDHRPRLVMQLADRRELARRQATPRARPAPGSR